MITVVTAYRLTCQGCGKEQVWIPDGKGEAHTLDNLRLWLRKLGWWVATVDYAFIRCPTCGEPKDWEVGAQY